jgi:uncharacterized protein YprB with RNaseH-like and TPR domain
VATGSRRLALRRSRAAELSLDRVLFLDTETTGLGRDATTFAFLVGVGWYDREEIASSFSNC